MSEFFWFFLGVLVYKILFSLLNLGYKATFLTKIKYLAFLLIGRAYQEMLLAQELKYKGLAETFSDDVQLKLHKNADEIFLSEWKRSAVDTLNSAVPIPYKNVVNLDDWKHLMDVMDNYYKEKMRRTIGEKQKNKKNADRS